MWGARWEKEDAVSLMLEYAHEIGTVIDRGQKVVHMQDFLRWTEKT